MGYIFQRVNIFRTCIPPLLLCKYECVFLTQLNTKSPEDLILTYHVLAVVTIRLGWIDNCVYWITVYTLQFITVHFTVFPLGQVSSRLDPGPPADPSTHFSLVKFKVTLQPTTSRSVRLGFEPRLRLMTRC
jgi:hypothetical protein